MTPSVQSSAKVPMNMVVSAFRFVNPFSYQQDMAVNGRTVPY